MTREEQILELSATVKCKLAPSEIHGIGVFAIKDIKEGERIYGFPKKGDNKPRWFTLNYSDLTKLPPEIREIILARWPCVVNNGCFMSPNYDQRLVSFMNHSDDANYDERSDTALKDIKIGEEITENYRNMENWQKVFSWLIN